MKKNRFTLISPNIKMLQSTVMTPGTVEIMGNVTAGERDWFATNNAA